MVFRGQSRTVKIEIFEIFSKFDHLVFTFIQNNNCIFICVSVALHKHHFQQTNQGSLQVELHVCCSLNMNRSIKVILVRVQPLHNRQLGQAGKGLITL